MGTLWGLATRQHRRHASSDRHRSKIYIQRGWNIHGFNAFWHLGERRTALKKLLYISNCLTLEITKKYCDLELQKRKRKRRSYADSNVSWEQFIHSPSQRKSIIHYILRYLTFQLIFSLIHNVFHLEIFTFFKENSNCSKARKMLLESRHSESSICGLKYLRFVTTQNYNTQCLIKNDETIYLAHFTHSKFPNFCTDSRNVRTFDKFILKTPHGAFTIQF